MRKLQEKKPFFSATHKCMQYYGSSISSVSRQRRMTDGDNHRFVFNVPFATMCSILLLPENCVPFDGFVAEPFHVEYRQNNSNTCHRRTSRHTTQLSMTIHCCSTPTDSLVSKQLIRNSRVQVEFFGGKWWSGENRARKWSGCGVRAWIQLNEIIDEWIKWINILRSLLSIPFSLKTINSIGLDGVFWRWCGGR